MDRRHARHTFSNQRWACASQPSARRSRPASALSALPSHSPSSRVTGGAPVPVASHLGEYHPVGRFFGEMSFSASSGASATGSNRPRKGERKPSSPFEKR